MSEKNNSTQLSITYRPLHEIIPLPDNTRVHDLTGIQESIAQFGFVDPILVSSKTLHDLDGNGRLEALKLMYGAGQDLPDGIMLKMEIAPHSDGKKVPVWYAPTVSKTVDRETEDILALRLNRAHAKGGYNEAKVFAVLEQASAFGRLEQTGYDRNLFEMLALRHAPAPEFVTPDGFTLPGNGSGSTIGEASTAEEALPGARLTMGQQQAPNAQAAPAAPTLAASHVRMVQLFLNADTQPVFFERTQRLTASKQYLDDNDTPVTNLTDLIISLVRDAHEELRQQEALTADD